jgi:hypothetical protein
VQGQSGTFVLFGGNAAVATAKLATATTRSISGYRTSYSPQTKGAVILVYTCTYVQMTCGGFDAVDRLTIPHLHISFSG